MKSFSDVIDQWPAPSLQSFAEDVGIRYGTAQIMRHRDRINSRYWRRIVKAAQARKIEGVSLELMAALAAREQDSRSSSRRVA